MRDEKTMTAAVTAAVLRRGKMLHAGSLLLTAVGLSQLCIAHFTAQHMGAYGIALAGATVLAGMFEFYYALRVAFDAEVFGLFANPEEIPSFDAVMTRMGLMPGDKSGRPLDARIAGAFALLKWQAYCLAAQVLLAAGSLSVMLTSTK